ncbi:Serpentine receptor class delta-48 [Caenorhabditis elegans]|uniref:Serpentine receptor class delta-48 n=1 Tax=Caenorhabditis elegans TaxID=6239 RepID=SRD48_CAEEL|nr:Serpentine receptor class delta-48 [Caenorhabditis elegans]O17822.1 RecName: Full=Serpentine receptor class delta-48; Short=Protein srd-48 [Caenorhabditis elegans]CAA92160.1 Serpentine receptor class delta-48 [Caenorhabditis elegans]|eukprot:NP_510067.1 Serpentine receptor class delta-48 [Caenorhabditis elegans]
MYGEILSFFYITFFILVLPTQIFGIFVILRFSTKHLKLWKKFLLCNLICQIISVATLCLLQLRQVSNLSPMEIWCYGPIRHFSAITSYLFYVLSQISTLMTYFLVFITIYLKYEAVKNVNKQNYRKVVIILMLLLPIFITMVAQIDLMIVFFSPNEAQKKFNELNAIITDHSVIGYVISGRISSFLLTVIIFGSVFLLPPAGFFIRKKIIRCINSTSDSASVGQKFQRRSFINGLTLQSFLPLVCICPIFACYFVVSRTKTDLPFEQHILPVLVMLPTLFDPYIILYSVTPYRKQIRTWLGMTKTVPMVIVASVMI